MLERVFPAEVARGIPCITLRGTQSVCVEQHQGLIGYQPEEIVFRTDCGLVKITGQGLRFTVYTAEEATIEGVISGVNMSGGGR